jgi:hypothetical protein
MVEIALPPDADFRLACPFSAIVAGPSQSGKTNLVVNLLLSGEAALTKKFDRIVVN